MATACYRPGYLPASYKGVPFIAQDISSEHGRRGAEGEFPFGETTAYADMGRSIRRYSVSGYFAENTHIQDSQALIAACESVGPGTLVHPTRGILTVACKSLRVKDNPETEQGVTYVDMEFVEASDFLTGLLDGASLFGLSLAPLLAAVTLSFSEHYRPDDVAWYNIDAVEETMVDAVTQLRNTFQSVTGNAPDTKTYRIIADFNTIVTDPATLRDPDNAIKVIKNGLAFIDSYTAGETKSAAFKGLVNWASKTSSFTSTSAEAQNAIYSSIRLLAVGYMIRGLLEFTPRTLGDGLAQYDTVTLVMQEELAINWADCYDNKLFLSLRDFAVKAQKQLLSRAYESPALVEYVFNGGIHSLVAAYEIYNDSSRFIELEQRNPQYLPWSFGPRIVAVGA